MARKSNIARDEKRHRMIAQHATKRRELKAEGNYEELQKLPRNASPVRAKNRCFACARPRGYNRKVGLCRICFREFANQGKIPGVRKSSW